MSTKSKQQAKSKKWRSACSSAEYSTADYAVLIGDAKSRLQSLQDSFVDTCLTSPPYWGVRDYEHESQIGQEETVDEYVENIVQVFRELRRVLKPEGTAWLNIGDRYLSTSKTVNGKPPEMGWERNKQLSLVPFRVALALEEDGWWIRNSVVWHKTNAMPSSVRDRLTNTWEPVFLLAKSEQYYFDLDAIRVPHKTNDEVERRRAIRGETNGKAKGNNELRKWLNSPRHRATIDGMKEVRIRPNAPDPVELAAYLKTTAKQKGINLHDLAETLGQPYERVRHYFRTDRIGSRLPPEDTWEQLKALLGLDERFDDVMKVVVTDNVFKNHPNGRNPGDLVQVALSGNSAQHFALMPKKLADWALKATLPKGGICIDPFMGHGTTGHSALSLGGRFIGIDVNDEYAKEFIKHNGKKKV